MTEKRAIIIGAGPAGLTAAYELLVRTDIKPLVFEMSTYLGGLARTVEHNGNRIDIGGHRFFSKSERVMKWWLDMMPLQGSRSSGTADPEPPAAPSRAGPDPDRVDNVMLERSRLSRIFFLRKLFSYPLVPSLQTVIGLGPIRVCRIMVSYIAARLTPIRPERSLEDFLINRFGRHLYQTFFRDYTEKVWGVPCTEIKPDWGAQRIKGISITHILRHAFQRRSRPDSVAQEGVETSLIDRFLYPKFGPGQMWERVAQLVEERGGTIFRNHEVVGLRCENGRIASVTVKDNDTGKTSEHQGAYVMSTMPAQDLIARVEPPPPEEVREVAAGLIYRDFITVGILLKKLLLKSEPKDGASEKLIPDNWIYIQEPDVKIGRLQIFNNWSPYMVKDPNTVWLGLEYFCNEGDELWTMPSDDFSAFAVDELAKLDIIDKADVLDQVVIRMAKAYPAYMGSYDRFNVIREYTDSVENLFLLGRNGMHRYNNQDHSMLTAMTAVDNILAGQLERENLWQVNTEQEYHEEETESQAEART